jgi:protease-4
MTDMPNPPQGGNPGPPPPWADRAHPIHVVVEQGGGLLGRLGRWLPWTLLALSVSANLWMSGQYRSYFSQDDGLRERYHSGDRAADEKIAIIKLSGFIDTEVSFVRRQIEKAEKDESVRAIVLRVQSPGGTIIGSHRIYHELRKLTEKRKIPMTVSMGSVAASGGYYASMAVGAQKEAGLNDATNVIFAEPTTITGSIGVIFTHIDASGLLQKLAVEVDPIKSHPLKDMGSPARKMTDEERAKFQAYVDESFEQFKSIIRAGRPYFKQEPEKLNELATGEIFSTRAAIENHLVDREGFLEDAIARAAELADLQVESTRVIEYEAPPTLLDQLGGQTSAPAIDMKSIVEMSTPQGYYLYGWLPALLSSGR